MSARKLRTHLLRLVFVPVIFVAVFVRPSWSMESTAAFVVEFSGYVFLLIGLLIRMFPYGSHRLDQVWEILCLAISLLGLGVRIVTVGYVPKGTSGRNTRGQKANVLNTTGMYSLVSTVHSV